MKPHATIPHYSWINISELGGYGLTGSPGGVFCREGLHTSLVIHSAIAKLAVRPGDSIPNRLIKPGTPCSFSDWTRNSVSDPPGRAIFGLIPEKAGCSELSGRSGQ